MASSSDASQRRKAAELLGEGFSLLEFKETAWNDLIRLAGDENNHVRLEVVIALRMAFPYYPDKKAAWKDLIRLAGNEDSLMRAAFFSVLEVAFQYVSDKNAAWKDRIRLTGDREGYLRWWAANDLGVAFQHVPDKEAAWKDLIRLAGEEDSLVRLGTTCAMMVAFQHVPDKEAAWKDLIRLARDKMVELAISGVLGTVFQYLADKKSAANDLHTLAVDKYSELRWLAADAFGIAFRYIPNKVAVCKDLISLTRDNCSEVRCTSCYSLGRISIFKATEADEDFRVHLEEAIEFFKRSLEEAKDSNPAAFCLPFYRSLHCLLFTDVPREEAVQKYLEEAKKAISASESRELLLEAVNNLSKALQEVRAYSMDDILLRKRDLRSYTRYCLQAAECLREARSKAPLASKVVDYTLVEKSIPIIDQKIKALFRDVQATAGELCKSTKGTDQEGFGRDAYESTRGLNKVETWIAADRYLEEIVPLLKGHCNRLPERAQAYLRVLVDSQDSASLEQRFDTLKSVLLASLVQGENDDRLVKELKELLDMHLQNIEFAILNLNTSSANSRKDLFNLKNQIDGLQKEIESQGLARKELSDALDEKDRAMIERLEKMREKMLRAVRETTQLNASKSDVETILKELDDQDRLKKRDALGIIADLSSLAGIALSILL